MAGVIVDQVGLAAEYGFYYRMPDEEEWQTMVPEIDTSWRDIVRPMLEVREAHPPATAARSRPLAR